MLPSQSLYTGTCERSMLVAVFVHDLRQRSYLAPPEDPRNGSSREVGVLDLGIPGPRDLGPSRSGTLEIWGPRDLGPSGSGPWGPVLGSPFEPSELTSGGPVRLCLSLCSAPQDALHRAAVRLVSSSEVLGWPRPHEMGSRPSQNGSFQGPKWVHFDPSEGPICGKSGSNGSQIRSIWGPRPLDPGIQTLKDTVKRSKGDSIDGQIMLFPITRAREGIYKDPGYPGSWDRPRTLLGSFGSPI